MKYVVKRNPVKYASGAVSSECYLKSFPLGMFVELTLHIEEAQVFTRKAEANKIAKGLGRRFEVLKIDQKKAVLA